MAQFSFPAHYQRSPQSAVPPFATGGALTGKRAVGTCAPVAEFLLNSQIKNRPRSWMWLNI